MCVHAPVGGGAHETLMAVTDRLPRRQEGFYGPSSPKAAYYNPGARGVQWAAKAGQDFVANHAHPSIDFAAVHIWPNDVHSPLSRL
jgi:hypothetical protein